MVKIIKNSFGNFFVILVIFSLVTGWIFSGWPRIWQNPPIPPRIEEAQAAITFINVAHYNSASSSSGTCNKPTNTAENDIMFAWIGLRNTYGYVINSVPSGWTLLGSQTANSDKYYLYYKVAGSSEPSSYTWGTSGLTKFAITIATYRGGFNTSDPIDVVSNTSYRTSDTINRAASMNVTSANSPLLFFAGSYNTSTHSYTKPSVPTSDWVEDYDGWNTNPDFAREICSMTWSGSGATGNIDATISVSLTTKHAFAVALKPIPTTILGSGTDPSNSTVAPGTANNYLDQFTFQTNTGTDSVTALTVTTTNTSAIASMKICSNDDNCNTQYFNTVTSPSGNNWNFSGGTSIPVTTSQTAFRVVFTAKGHSELAEGTYGVTGYVSSFTCTNSQAGSDSAGTTITIDNAPPSNATWETITPSNQEIQLTWTNPESDFYQVLILRKTGSSITDAPTDGTEYSVNDTIGDSIVRYVGDGTIFTDTGLTNGTEYYYKIFAYDPYINYASGSGTGPHIPIAISISLNRNTQAFGNVPLEETVNNSADPIIITVESGPADLNVKTTLFSDNGNSWSLGTTNGNKQVKWEFSKDGANWTIFEVADTEYPFDTNVPTSGTRDLHLRLTMPTETDSYNQYTATITIIASVPD